MRAALLLLMLLLGRMPAAVSREATLATPSVATILERALEQARKEEEQTVAFKRNYYFTRTRVTEFKNSKGVVKKRDEKVTNNDPVRRRRREAETAVLNPPVVQASTDDKEISETETNVKGRAFEKSDFPLDGDLLSRFVFTYVRQERVNDRPAYVLDFKPVRPAVPDRNLKDKFINKAAGRVWIDVEDAAIAKADLYLTQRVNVAGGLVGAVWKFTCTMDRDRTPEGFWYVRQSDWHLEGREVLVKRVVDCHEERTDLQPLRMERPHVDGASVSD